MAQRLDSSSEHSFELDRGWSLLDNPEFSVHNFGDPTDMQLPQSQRMNNGPMETQNGFQHNHEPQQTQQVTTNTVHSNDEDPLVSSKFSTYHPPLRKSNTTNTSQGSQQENEKSSSLPHPLSSGVGLDPAATINAGQIYNSFPRLSNSDDGCDSDQNDTNIKTSLMSVWNNMKNGFTVQMKTNFKYDCPIWLLGCLYHCTREDREIQKEKHDAGINCITAMDEFKTDFQSRIWFTYRKDFARLPFSSLTTDMGWGCMLRSGQMMLAQALIMHLLGRSWKHIIHRSPSEIYTHKKIIKLFSDIDSVDTLLSIHNLVKIGKAYGKNPGDWYGPSSVAFVLRDVVTELSASPLVSDLCLYVAQDCTLYKDDLLDLCSTSSRRSSVDASRGTSNSEASSGQAGSSDKPWSAVIVLIPVRLGGVQFNPVYAPCLKAMLAHKFCIGIIGGKPKHSLYFVGWQEDKLIYLDPHFCQDFVDTKDPSFPTDSFHCKSPRKVSFTKMDPSCTVGFYCKTKEDLDIFLREIPTLSIPPLESTPHPMFVFQDGHSEDSVLRDTEETEERILKVQHYDSEGRRRPIKDSDDFVLL